MNFGDLWRGGRVGHFPVFSVLPLCLRASVVNDPKKNNHRGTETQRWEPSLDIPKRHP